MPLRRTPASAQRRDYPADGALQYVDAVPKIEVDLRRVDRYIDAEIAQRANLPRRRLMQIALPA